MTASNSRRHALLIATDLFQDAALSQLSVPPVSAARKLAALLRDPLIGGFEITWLHNRPHDAVGQAIDELYRGRGPDDLVLLYIMGHGRTGGDGHLQLAAADTDRKNLPFTSVQGQRIRAAVDGCRSRRKVMILDCSYAGPPPAPALEQLGGPGSVILTTANALPGFPLTQQLVEGLRTGRADLDDDGEITHDELYRYAWEQLARDHPHQRPRLKEAAEARITIARNINWALPVPVHALVSSTDPSARLRAVAELAVLYDAGNAIVKRRVMDAMLALKKDTSQTVVRAIAELVARIRREARAEAEAEQKAAAIAAYIRADVEAKMAQHVADRSGPADRAEAAAAAAQARAVAAAALARVEELETGVRAEDRAATAARAQAEAQARVAAEAARAAAQAPESARYQVPG
jgi:hypothetical protein